MFFERFNVAALAIFEKPILQLFAANAISGVVVDVGEEYTEITAIVDAMVHYPSILPFEGGPHSVPLGTRHCELYLAQILRSNQALIAKISPPQSPLPELMLTSVLLKIVRQALQDGLIKVPSDGLPVPPDTEEEGVTNIAAVLVAGKERAVIEAGSRKKSALNEKKGAAEREREREIAALDLVDVEVSFFPNEGSSGSMEEERTIKVTLGKERHRFAEPLFSPSLLEGVPEVSPEQLSKKMLGLHEAIRLIVGSVDWDKRPSVWDAVYLTGDLIGVKS
jgi:actin-related protein 9